MEQVGAVTNFCDLPSYFIDIWLPQLEPLSPKPNAVLLPCTIAIENLKISCVQRKISLANVRFFTPASLKSFLKESLIFPSSEGKNHVISQKVLKFWSWNILKSDSARRDLILQAIRGDLETFLEAFKFWRQTFPSQRTLFFDANFSFFAEALDQFLSQHGWVTSIEEAYGQTLSEKKFFQETLIGGFSPQARDSLPLLKVMVKLSNHSIIRNLLSGDPHWDALWQQATFYLRNYDTSSSYIPLSALELIDASKEEESENNGKDSCQAEFFIAQNSNEEVMQLCRKLQQLLTLPLEDRIAIVLSQENSPEAVLLQERLHQEKIQFTSSYPMPSQVQTYPVINAWCQWQKSDHIDDYFQWIQSLANEAISIPLKKELEKEVSKSMTSLGTYRSNLLLDWTLSETKNDTLRSFLKTWNLLPIEAQIREFSTFLPKAIIPFLEQELLPSQFSEEKCSRYSFIEFFETSLRELTSQKTEKLSSSFAKVCLLSPEEALYGTWKFVFFFHCVEQASRSWEGNPWIHRAWRSQSRLRRDHPQIFLSKEGANLPLKTRNRKYFSLLSLRKIQKECFGRNSYFFAISRNDDHSNLTFNLFFLENYAKQYGFFPKPDLGNPAKVAAKSILKTNPKKSFLHLKKTYQARRDPQNPFGVWDYSLDAPLGEYFSFSCKTWESILQNPEESWYRHILQQEPCPVFAEQEWIKLARGTWAHNFLSFPEASEEPQNVPDLGEGYEHISCRAHSFKKKIETFLSVHGAELTFIWETVWNEALLLSRQLFQRVAMMGNSLRFRSEFTLLKGSRLQFSPDTSLPLTGRVDLWLQEEAQSYVIDYKTGGDRTLRRKKWVNENSRGKVASVKGLQLALYGIALQEKGWKNIQLLILKPDSPIGDVLDNERVDLKALLKEDSFREFLRIFEHIAARGILGLRPNSHFVQQSLKRPLAVLPIEDSVLQKRCIKTFTCLWD